MDFGKLASAALDKVDFKLAPLQIPAFTPSLDQPPRLRIGYTGWAVKEWVQMGYYPVHAHEQYLYYYAELFDGIELNTTHYRIPDAKTVEFWCESTTQNPNFRFSPKILQAISHSDNLDTTHETLKKFINAVQGLGASLGTSFIQFPPHFGFKRLPELARLLEICAAEGFKISVEIRNAAWLANPEQLKAYFETLTQYGAGTVLTDVAGRRDMLHQTLTNTTLMLRWVGNGLHPSDATRLADWRQLLIQHAGSGIQDIYVFLHQPNPMHLPACVECFSPRRKLVPKYGQTGLW